MDYSGIVDDAIQRLKTEGRYRSFAEIERIPGTASAMLRAPDGTTSTVAVWCSNDYLGMAANAAVIEAVTAAIGPSPAGRFLLVANLPYCVATPVISNLLALPRPFDSATVTVQREMAERMSSPAGSHSYNALSVWIGAQCRTEIIRVLPPSVFWPRPKVESAIVRIDLEPQRRAAIENLSRFHDFVRDIFCHRRKLLRGVLVRIAGGKQNPEARTMVERVYQSMGFTASVRAEEIPPDQFVLLEREFFKHRCNE